MKVLFPRALAVLLLGTAPLVAQSSPQNYAAAIRAQYVPLSLVMARKAPLPERLTRRVSVHQVRVPLQQALFDIATQARLGLAYGEDVAMANTLVSLAVDHVSAAVALEAAVQGTGWIAMVTSAGQVLVVKAPADIAQGMTGTIAGRVTASTTRAPIAGAMVTVVGTNLRRVTDDSGRFVIAAVPAGERDIIARRLGFEPRSQRVTVRDGERVTADFALSIVPTMLQEMVTTVTGERSRLEVGNSIGTIKADSLVPTTLIRNMSDLLQARIPGVSVSNTSGLLGSPSKIRIRGVNSIRLNNDPIVILDGVRLLSQQTIAPSQTNVGTVSTTTMSAFGVHQLLPSRLDDIDPTIIESIDVLRGPSAASLYGTEAANGVIVVKTKRGSAGPWHFNLMADNGWSYLPGAMPSQWYAWGHQPNAGTLGPSSASTFVSCYAMSTVVNSSGIGFFGPSVADGTCVQDSLTAFNPENDPQMRTFGVGGSRTVDAGLSGGSDQLQERLALRISDNIGMAKMSEDEQRRIARLWSSPPPPWMVHPNTEQDINASSRTSLRITSNADLSLSANGVYRNVLNGGSGVPLIGTGGVGGAPAGLTDTLRYLPSELQREKNSSLAKRGFVSVAGNYSPFRALALHGTLGGDYTLRTDDALDRAVDCTAVLSTSSPCTSAHANGRGETFVVTADVGANLTLTPLRWLTTRTALGEQYGNTRLYSLAAQNSFASVLAFGTDLLTPTPVATTTGAQLFSVTESRDESATAGWYLEQTAAVRDRLFITGGFRQDVASAFGRATNASAPIYPKVSLSWLLSEEPFFPHQSLVSNFRVRTAYGHSGQQASQTDVLNGFVTGNALSMNGTTVIGGIRMSQLGNPNLRPERTTEWEGGFDVSLLENERVHLETTVYRKLSQDAILQVTLPGSYGITGNLNQNVNVGSVENRGMEVSMTAKVLDSRRLGWDLTINVAQNANKLVHRDTLSAKQAPGNFLSTSLLREGYPIYGNWGYQIQSYADLNRDGILSYREVTFGNDTVFFGASYPRSELNYVSSLTLLGGLFRVDVNLDQVVGLSVWRRSVGNGGSGTNGDRALVDRTTPLAQQALAIEALANGGYQTETSSLRLSELSLTCTISKTLAYRVARAQSAAVIFAGRNLALWTNYTGQDPNASTLTATFQEIPNTVGLSIPQPRNWTIRINLGY